MTAPFAILYIHQAMLIVPLVILAILALLLFNGLILRRSQELRISRLIISKCKNCNLVFVASRFSRARRLQCPRCKHENPVEHRKY